MANVSFKKGLLAGLASQPKTEGTIYITIDERAIYLDVDGSTRIRLGDFIQVASVSALPTSGADTTALYYAVAENILCRYNGSAWVQINPDTDTGATDIEISGSGAKVTGVSYDDSARKITVSLGALTADDIPSIAHGKISDWDTELNKKQDSLTFEGTYNASTNKAATQSTVSDAIAALDKADTAVSGQYVSAVSETDGVITVSRETLPTAPAYSITKDATSTDYAAVYHLTKDGVNTGVAINIPKDMVVSGGEVVTDPAGQAAGTYIKLTLQNVTDPLYINVGDLIEYVTSGSAVGDMVVVAVSDDHKVTATITDGTITKAKLHTDVQTELNKAHEHSNKAVLDGITQTKVNAWDAAEANVQADWSETDTTSDAYIANKPTLGTAAAADTGDFEAAGAVSTAIAALDVADTVEAGKYVSGVSETDGKITVTRASLPDYSNTYEAKGAAAAAVGALDKADTAVDGQYVSAVSQTDGVITVSRASLPAMEWGSF